MDVAVQKRRFVIAMTLNVVAAMICMGAIVAAMAMHSGRPLWALVVAIGIGFAAQIWLIVGFLRAKDA